MLVISVIYTRVKIQCKDFRMQTMQTFAASAQVIGSDRCSAITPKVLYRLREERSQIIGRPSNAAKTSAGTFARGIVRGCWEKKKPKSRPTVAPLK